MADDAYTVSKMLSSFNAVMAPVTHDPSVSVSLKRKMDNGVMLDTSEKEIAYLDMQAKVKHSAQRVAKFSREGKAKWVDEQRVKGKEAFERQEYSTAADLYVQALTALDFGDSQTEKEDCQLNMQVPLTCNLAACMLMMEQWTKARQMCDEALKINPKYVKALQQRARAFAKLNLFDNARDNVHSAIAAIDDPVDTLTECDRNVLLSRLEKQLADIDRAEKRHKQQLLQEKQFHKKMMREAVGKLYQDKKEVSFSSAGSSDAQKRSTSSLSSRLREGWMSLFALPAFLQLAATLIGRFFSCLLPKPQAKVKEL